MQCFSYWPTFSLGAPLQAVTNARTLRVANDAAQVTAPFADRKTRAVLTRLDGDRSMHLLQPVQRNSNGPSSKEYWAGWVRSILRSQHAIVP